MTLSMHAAVGFQQQVIILYIVVSGMALQVYDFFQTLELEVEYIWKPTLTPFKLLYIFMKYLPFVDVSLLLILSHASLTPEECRIINILIGWSFMVGLTTTQVVLTLRTWVLWGRSRYFAFPICCFALFWATYGFYVNNSVLQDIRFVVLDGSSISVCVPSRGSNYSKVWVNWMLQLIYDALLCVLLVIRVAIESRRGRVSRPIFIIYRDGIAYYFYVFILSLVFIFWIGELGAQFPVPTLLLTRIIHPMLAARVVLHAREQAHRNKCTYKTTGIISTTCT